MKLIAAFFKLVRWPNLVFIALTQLMFYSCVYLSVASNNYSINQLNLLLLLITASVLIAAAGYIINDYFDIKIDTINKPQRLIIGKIIKRRWAIVWHWLLSGIGILLSIYISYKINVWIITIVNVLCVLALLFYSTTFKRKLLSGNLIIAALTAWTILVVYFFVGANLFSLNGWEFENDGINVRKLFKFTLLYAGFAFIMTLIREVIKDLEDMDGDRQYNCNTMPIAWGVPASKVFTAVWIIVATAVLLVVQLYVWQLGKWATALYFLVFIIAPLVLLLHKLKYAKSSSDFAKLSNLVKLIILTGIISMVFIKFSY